MIRAVGVENPDRRGDYFLPWILLATMRISYARRSWIVMQGIIVSIIIKIEPVETVTENGTTAYITGINMTSGDPYHGKIIYEQGKERPARWRSNGFVRDALPDFNLQMGQSEVREVWEVAKHLGARLNPNPHPIQAVQKQSL